MHLPSETLAEEGALRPALASSPSWRPDATGWPVAVLALMMLPVPAVGVPS